MPLSKIPVCVVCGKEDLNVGGLNGYWIHPLCRGKLLQAHDQGMTIAVHDSMGAYAIRRRLLGARDLNIPPIITTPTSMRNRVTSTQRTDPKVPLEKGTFLRRKDNYSQIFQIGWDGTMQVATITNVTTGEIMRSSPKLGELKAAAEALYLEPIPLNTEVTMIVNERVA